MKTIFGIKGLPLTEYGIAANAILGIRDSGKTYTATEATEELFDSGIPSIWLDPIGVAHNLRIPGKGRGYPIVVAGGRFGDLPLTVKNAGAIVRAAMQQGVSLVIDLFSTELSKADWRKIVRECVEILLYENHDYGLRHVFIEEAAEFVPQRVVDGQVFAAVEKLVRMGGNSKLGCTLINQRSEDLNKSVLELCANVFLHRQRGKNSLTGMKKWLDLVDPDEAKKVMDSVPDLKSGECWVLSNELKHPVRIKIPEKNSLHPDRRASAAPAGAVRKAVPADKFVDAMKAALTEKPKAAQTSKPVEKTSTAPDAGLKNREAAFQTGIKQGRESGYPEGWLDGEKAGFTRGVAATLTKLKSWIGEAAAIPYEAGTPPKRVPRGADVARTPAAALKVPQGTLATAAPRTEGHLADGLSRPQQKLLDALAWMESIGISSADRVRAAFLADVSSKSSGFEKNVSTLKTLGMISYPGSGMLALTPDGRARANRPESAPTTADLHAAIRSNVSAPQWALLDELCAVYPESLSREDLAQRANVSAASSGFEKNVSTLKGFGFVDYPDKGHVAATAVMFVEAR